MPAHKTPPLLLSCTGRESEAHGLARPSRAAAAAAAAVASSRPPTHGIPAAAAAAAGSPGSSNKPARVHASICGRLCIGSQLGSCGRVNASGSNHARGRVWAAGISARGHVSRIAWGHAIGSGVTLSAAASVSAAEPSPDAKPCYTPISAVGHYPKEAGAAGAAAAAAAAARGLACPTAGMANATYATDVSAAAAAAAAATAAS